jgi:fumarate hydratase class II
MMPLLAYETLFSLDLLSEAVLALAEKCIAGITADEEKCRSWIEWSLAMVTPLALKIGYDQAAQLAYRAWKERKTVRELAVIEGIVSGAEADEIFNPEKMI